jgi:hypothetical protein
MNWKAILAGFIGTAAAWSAEPAARYGVTDTEDRTRVAYDSNHQWRHYKANELNFEVFGMGTLGRSTISDIAEDDIERDGNFGPGLGVSYFVHRNVGIQAEAYHDGSRGGEFVDSVGGHLVGRFPIGTNGVAPYIFGGAGRQFDPGLQWTWDAGAGLEWRFRSHIGVFIDLRYVWPEKSGDYGLGRLGLKFGF